MQRPPIWLWLSLLTALAGGASCRSKQPPAATTASARPSAARPAPPAPSASSSARRNPSGCRVLAVTGTSADAPEPPAVGRLFSADEWLELGAGVRVSLRHTESSREFSLRGPGRVRACRAGAEAVNVALGTVETAAGPGARAGAEVVLATPFAVLHFADAKLVLEVSERKLTLAVEQGNVTVEPLAGKSAEPKTVAGPKGTLTLSGKSDPDALVAACIDARKTVASGAQRPSAVASAGSGLGEWAANQWKARRAARFACGAADSAVGRLSGSELSRLSGLLEGAEAAEKRPVRAPGR